MTTWYRTRVVACGEGRKDKTKKDRSTNEKDHLESRWHRRIYRQTENVNGPSHANVVVKKSMRMVEQDHPSGSISLREDYIRFVLVFLVSTLSIYYKGPQIGCEFARVMFK